MSEQSIKPIRILRAKQVAERAGISRSLIYKFVREGKFPAAVRLGDRAVGWHESDVDGWIQSRVSNARVTSQGVQA